MEFKNLPLHDAVLEAIEYEWNSHQVKATGLLFGNNSKRFTIFFHVVTSLEVPNNKEWGPSSSINEVNSNVEGVFTIEMQSGDCIRIEAEKFNYETNDT